MCRYTVRANSIDTRVGSPNSRYVKLLVGDFGDFEGFGLGHPPRNVTSRVPTGKDAHVPQGAVHVLGLGLVGMARRMAQNGAHTH